ncbi:MAG TPA: GNAT family N-acetyltransferase [Desulfobacterales bacterium]|nr:GNAT family N-acetyltransferase [Desulfobacterales bacterium]
MVLRIVSDPKAIDRKQWERFVYDHPQGNVFQTPQMYTAYSATKNYQPIVVACYEKDALVGILLAVVQKEYKGILGKLSARSIIWGGPLVRDDDISILEELMNEYDRTIKKQAIVTQIRNIFSLEWAKDQLQKLGYEYEDHLNILVNLEKSEEELWKEVHANRRNKINRARKNGLQFRLFNDEQSLRQVYSVLKDIYRRTQMPLPDLSLFLNLVALPEKESPLRLFIAYNKENIAGIMLALCYRERVFEWYVGGEQRYFNKYPNDMIPWEVFLWGKSHGYKVFDFGGAGKPGIPYGVREFKLKFGGDLVNLGRFQKTHKPLTMNVAKLGFRLWQLLKK